MLKRGQLQWTSALHISIAILTTSTRLPTFGTPESSIDELTCNTCNKVCFGLNLILEFVRRVNYICIFLRFLSHTTLSAIWLSLYLHSIGEELPKQFLSPKSSICLFHHRRWAVTNLGIALNASALASPPRKLLFRAFQKFRSFSWNGFYLTVRFRGPKLTST